MSTITALLVRNDVAVNRAMVALANAGIKEANYYATWIETKGPLTGKFIDKARAVAVANVATLERIVAEKSDAATPVPAARSSASLAIARQGKFHIETYGPNHCGTMPELDVKYDVRIECKAAVDGRGFLFDQVQVDRFFQTVKKTGLSCENLCMTCAEALVDLIRKENPGVKILNLSLTLSPEPFAAGVTYAWKE
jgi:hypothetical protein